MISQTDNKSTEWKVAKLTSNKSLVFSIGQRLVLSSSTPCPTFQLQTEPLSITDEQAELMRDEAREMISSNQKVDGWISYVQKELYLEPTVESVHVGIDEGTVDFWIVIPKRDIEVVKRIADTQSRIMDVFGRTEKPSFFMDFHIIYRNGHDEGEWIPKRTIRLPRQV
jgi:hypothetical protein